ncbi:MAG: SPOR domain-containing protein [Elusimicrobia bacterium]|nr:SPOR domain-containing protein [Elusimicrobiota bacterium]
MRSLLLACLAQTLPLHAAEPVQLRGIDTAPDLVVLRLSAPVQYKMSVEGRPPRLVIDLFNTRLKRALEPAKGYGALLKGIRSAQLSKEPDWVARVILDVEKEPEYKIRWGTDLMTVELAEMPAGTPNESAAAAPTPEPAPGPPRAETPAAPPAPAPASAPEKKISRYAVQLGSFTEKDRAMKVVETLRAAGRSARLSVRKSGRSRYYYVVRVGPFERRADAVAAVKQLSGQGYPALLIKQ